MRRNTKENRKILGNGIYIYIYIYIYILLVSLIDKVFCFSNKRPKIKSHLHQNKPISVLV